MNSYDPEMEVSTRESISTFDHNDWKLFDTILEAGLAVIAESGYKKRASDLPSDIYSARAATADLIRATIGYKFFRSSVAIPFGYIKTGMDNMEARLREEGFGNAIDTLLVDKKNVDTLQAAVDVLLPKVLEEVFVVPGMNQPEA